MMPVAAEAWDYVGLPGHEPVGRDCSRQLDGTDL
jgi:hypothetical protein